MAEGPIVTTGAIQMCPDLGGSADLFLTRITAGALDISTATAGTAPVLTVEGVQDPNGTGVLYRLNNTDSAVKTTLTEFYPNGTQRWWIGNAANAGSIQYAMPGSVPGVIVTDASSNYRSDIRHIEYTPGGFAILSSSGSTNAGFEGITLSGASGGSATLRVYNTTNGGGTLAPSNYERGAFDWSSNPNILTIGTQKGGTGATRAVSIVTGGTSAINIATDQTVTIINNMVIGAGGSGSGSQAQNFLSRNGFAYYDNIKSATRLSAFVLNGLGANFAHFYTTGLTTTTISIGGTGQTTTAPSSSQTAMTWDVDNFRVGIKNETPAIELDVNGSIRSASSLTTNLPAAGNAGARRFVTDATSSAVVFGSTLGAGGSSFSAPVYDDGAKWRYG